MIETYLFESIMPFFAVCSVLYWILGGSEKIKITLVISWTIIIMYLLLGITFGWFS